MPSHAFWRDCLPVKLISCCTCSGGQSEMHSVPASSSAQPGQDPVTSELSSHQQVRLHDSETPAESHEPVTGADGMSLQSPSLPSQLLQQQQQLPGMPAQLVAGSAQAQQQQEAALAAATAAAMAAGSPREVGQLGVAGQKQAPKPPLAPGSKSVPQVCSYWTPHLHDCCTRIVMLSRNTC